MVNNLKSRSITLASCKIVFDDHGIKITIRFYHIPIEILNRFSTKPKLIQCNDM